MHRHDGMQRVRNKFFKNLPAVEQVEERFKRMRFLLWNVFELLLLLTAMTAIGREALRHVPMFPGEATPPAIMGTPRDNPAEEQTRPAIPLEPQQPQENRRNRKRNQSRPHIVRVFDPPSVMQVPILNRASTESFVNIETPPHIDSVRTEYSIAGIPFGLEKPKPRQHIAVRALKVPVRSMKAIARKMKDVFGGEEIAGFRAFQE